MYIYGTVWRHCCKVQTACEPASSAETGCGQLVSEALHTLHTLVEGSSHADAIFLRIVLKSDTNSITGSYRFTLLD